MSGLVSVSSSISGCWVTNQRTIAIGIGSSAALIENPIDRCLSGGGASRCASCGGWGTMRGGRFSETRPCASGAGLPVDPLGANPTRLPPASTSCPSWSSDRRVTRAPSTNEPFVERVSSTMTSPCGETSTSRWTRDRAGSPSATSHSPARPT
jgi:hypothetical protein